MAVTIKLRRGYLAKWEEVNPILAEGEPGWAIDAFILKVGNGQLRWTELPAINVPDIDPADIEKAVFKYLEDHPINVETDATLSVAGKAADAKAVRDNCLFNTDQIIFYAGDADDNTFQ
jgi:hypothetical protein